MVEQTNPVTPNIVWKPKLGGRNLGCLSVEQLVPLIDRYKLLYLPRKKGGIDIDVEYNCYILKLTPKQYQKKILWEPLGLGEFCEDLYDDFNNGVKIFDEDFNDNLKKEIDKSMEIQQQYQQQQQQLQEPAPEGWTNVTPKK